MSQHGRIGGRFPANELNSVSSHVNIGNNILLEPEYKAGKEVIVPFSVVVAQENNRGSITSAQAAGRASAGSRTVGSRRGLRSVPAVVSDSDIVNALTTATNVASNVANAFGTQSLPGQRWRQRQPAPALAKTTKKRKAFGDVGNMDMGLRKLRSRK